MESKKSHRGGSISRDFFLCFTWRASSSSSSSSSMKLSSKSIVSPGRTDKFREPTFSLSTSLSRRLSSNGSMKGGQASPMFPTGSKKRGCAFENPEPSSPKVTCIGQVRVKTKKQGRKITRSKRKGEVSFRRTEQIQEGILHNPQQQDCLPYRNQRWVHLPLTICEALRAFGSEFNCFLPCKSSCSSTSEREKEEKATSPSCGASFARWLMALQESEDKRRETDMEIRITQEEKREITEAVNEIHIEEDRGETMEEEEKRVSICIPPRNALLLMRCRSDPLKMASLANRFCDSPVKKEDSDDEFQEAEEQDNENNVNEEEQEEEKVEIKEKLDEENEQRMSVKWVSCEVIAEEEDPQMEESPEIEEKKEDLEVTEEGIMEFIVNTSSLDALEEELEILEKEENEPQFRDREEEDEEEKEEMKERRTSFSSSFTVPVQKATEEEEEAELKLESESKERAEESTEEKVTEERETQEKSAIDKQEQAQKLHDQDLEEERETMSIEREKETSSLLPDCLLLMMYEPKLSMEVSKETWVCSRDFIRWRPDKQQVVPINGEDESTKSISIDFNTAQHHKPLQNRPPRSSFSNHAPTTVVPSMATLIEQKLVNAAVYEPFVLTRCKSEPMRSAAKLAPDACFWKNRKLEPHRPTTLGVGAAGVGF